MSGDQKTDRFRAVFEPEDIFERFVKNANAGSEGAAARQDEPTGRVVEVEADAASGSGSGTGAGSGAGTGSRSAAGSGSGVGERAPARGGPPRWDHHLTVKGAPLDAGAAPETRGGSAEPASPPAADGTVRMRSPFAQTSEASRELPDLEVDEDEQTRVASRALTPSQLQRLTARAREAEAREAEAREAQARRPAVSPPTSAAADAAAEQPEPDPEGTRPDAPMTLAMARAFDAAPPADAPDGAGGAEGAGDSGQRVLLLTRRKPPSSPPRGVAEPESEPDILADLSSPAWKSVVASRGQRTQRLEAMKVVPDVEAARRKDEDPAAEGGEDGQMPTRQLDQILADMAVLLRYGHVGQVKDRLDDLRRTYPEDLLLHRAIAEFYVEHDVRDAACETLFALAGGLFERRNVEGMRQALEQVLVLDPGNERAQRLLGLLEQRSGS